MARDPRTRPSVEPVDADAVNTGDTAWLLAASALVLLMAPGLALFYGGMVRSKSVLNMMMMVFGALAVGQPSSGCWSGYSLAFGDDVGARPAGRPDAVPRPSHGMLAGRHRRAPVPADHAVRDLPGALRRHHGRR